MDDITDKLRQHAGIMNVNTALTQRLKDRLGDIKKDFSSPWEATNEAPEPQSEELDLITAPLILPTHANPPALLTAWFQALKPDGLLLASTWGAESYPELQQIYPTAALRPLPEIRDVGSALGQAGYAMPVIDRDVITLTFSSLARLSDTLQHWGLLAEPLPPELEENYRRTFPREDTHLPLTMEILYLTGWRPDATQPQPLKPGAYKVKIGELPK